MSQWNKAAKKRQRILQLCEQRVKEREVHPGAGYKSVQFMVIPSEYEKLPTCMCLGWFLWNMRSGSFVYAWSVTKSCPTLCDPMDCSPPGSSVHEISHARTLEWLAISCSGDLPARGIETMSLAFPSLAGKFFTTMPPGKPLDISVVVQ